MGFRPLSTKRATRSSRWVVCAVFLLVFASAGPAAAQVPGDISSVDQYIEQLPAGGGKQPTGTGGGKGGTGSVSAPPLPRPVREALHRFGGDDAPLLEAAATLPAFGAPGETLRRSTAGSADSNGGGGSKGGSGGRADPSSADGVGYPDDGSFGEAISSGVGALVDSDGNGGPSPLLVAILAISAALVSVAVWRAVRNRA